MIVSLCNQSIDKIGGPWPIGTVCVVYYTARFRVRNRVRVKVR